MSLMFKISDLTPQRSARSPGERVPWSFGIYQYQARRTTGTANTHQTRQDPYPRRCGARASSGKPRSSINHTNPLTTRSA